MEGIIKTILAPLLCFVVIKTAAISLCYYPLLFGSAISMVNWKKNKYGSYLGVFLCLIASYSSFYIACHSLPFVMIFFNLILNDCDSAAITALILNTFVMAPLLVFFCFRFLFPYPKTKYSLIVIISVILFILLLCFLFYFFTRNGGIAFIYWPVIMAFALQLLIYQKIDE